MVDPQRSAACPFPCPPSRIRNQSRRRSNGRNRTAGGRMQTNGVDVASVSLDSRGRHRISAELKRLEQEARFLQEELEEFEKIEKGSAILQVLLLQVESTRDPLLPETNGPANTSWDRWFDGPQDKQVCRCGIL